MSACPSTGGVYVITYNGPAAFVERSCGGWFKGKDPTVPRSALLANWVEGAEVVYIGKADQLRRRLTQFADFGEGKPIGHWGGRLIWRLPSVEALRVAWKETPGRVPVEVESELIAAFRQAHGKPPFANDPHRLGA
ncbi:MAG TPA: GIY-YIG nuclease family protein [Allosphingosinicella sp.]|uniref:GIY-YIG nuclease family protein n=1 Tax=Allosphingosinicella sp. TaxID=2823234 RepID=UPI002EDAB25D